MDSIRAYIRVGVSGYPGNSDHLGFEELKCIRVIIRVSGQKDLGGGTSIYPGSSGYPGMILDPGSWILVPPEPCLDPRIFVVTCPTVPMGHIGRWTCVRPQHLPRVVGVVLADRGVLCRHRPVVGLVVVLNLVHSRATLLLAETPVGPGACQ